MKILVINLTVFFSFFISNTFAQRNGVIQYLVPESVMSKIRDYIKESDNSKRYTFYGIWQTQNDTTSILISRFDGGYKKLDYLIKNSNRYINLSTQQKLPLILTSDLLFSTELHSILFIKGKKAINDVLLNPSGFLIVFVGTYDKERILKAEHFQN